MKRSALLIIDMQNDFVLDSAPMKVAQARAVIPKILEVLEVFRSRKFPVFHLLRIHRSMARMSRLSAGSSSGNNRLLLKEHMELP